MWLGNSRLCMEYPRLFALENDKECKVATKLHGPFESSFRRNVRGGIESSQLSHILGDLESVVLSNAEDRRLIVVFAFVDLVEPRSIIASCFNGREKSDLYSRRASS
ncbi:hypothetical protein Tco_0621690 [Tanacetum coccineum]